MIFIILWVSSGIMANSIESPLTGKWGNAVALLSKVDDDIWFSG